VRGSDGCFSTTTATTTIIIIITKIINERKVRELFLSSQYKILPSSLFSSCRLAVARIHVVTM
jgi:hypothetical protein